MRRPVLLVLLVASSIARADPAVLSQRGVAQYDAVVAGLREIRDTEPVDVATPDAVQAALARGPGAVVAVGSHAVEAARRQRRAPVIGAAVLSPELEGVGGVALEARAAEAVRALVAVAPRARRVVALHPPGAAALVADAQAAAKAAGLEIRFEPLDGLGDFQGAFRRAIEGEDAAWLLPDPRLARPELVKFMVTVCLERRVALIGFLDGMARTGALLSVAPDFRAIGREAARLAADAEARGPGARVPVRFVAGKVTVNARVLEMLQLGGAAPAGAELVR